MIIDQYDLNGYGVEKLTPETKNLLNHELEDHLTNSETEEVFAVIYEGINELDPFNYSLCPLDMVSYMRCDYVWTYFTAEELTQLLNNTLAIDTATS